MAYRWTVAGLSVFGCWVLLAGPLLLALPKLQGWLRIPVSPVVLALW
jgi:hypothetical protein